MVLRIVHLYCVMMHLPTRPILCCNMGATSDFIIIFDAVLMMAMISVLLRPAFLNSFDKYFSNRVVCNTF